MQIITKLHFHQKCRHYNRQHIMVEHFQKAKHWKHLESLHQIKCIYRNICLRQSVRIHSSYDTNISFPLKSNCCCNDMKIIRDLNDIDLLLI